MTHRPAGGTVILFGGALAKQLMAFCAGRAA